MSEFIFAKVIRIIDEQRLLINAGFNQGVRQGDLFHIIEIGEEISDPDNNEVLGKMELVKAVVEAYHVQENMTLLSTLKNPNQTSSYSVLSATLAQTSSSGRPELDPTRMSLSIRSDQVRSYYVSAAVSLGDSVRSVHPKD